MALVPEITGALRNHIIEMPTCVDQATGIRIFGRLIKSVLFSTDIAVIRNCNADAVIAVYPFTPQQAITQALMMGSDLPVFCGVGGGITTGKRTVHLAQGAEFQGAMGVVVNAPTRNEVIKEIREAVDIPIIVTVVSDNVDVQARLDAGARILNVSGAAKTPDIVAKIRQSFPEVPILATGGTSCETIEATIQAGANAISITPPSCADIFKSIMNGYRQNQIG